jgi:hypothetical protein
MHGRQKFMVMTQSEDNFAQKSLLNSLLAENLPSDRCDQHCIASQAPTQLGARIVSNCSRKQPHRIR